MSYYIKSKTTHHETGQPAIAIHSSVTPGGLPLRYVVFPDQETLDKEFDGFDPDAEYERYGLPAPPVETFLDFVDCAFDARDLIAVAVQDAPLAVMASDGRHPFRLVMRFRQGLTDIMFIDFPTVEERDTVYARIVAAMKASRA